MTTVAAESTGSAHDLSHVQIHFDKNLGLFFGECDYEKQPVIDIDLGLLAETMEDFGEFKISAAQTPLEINILAARFYSDLLGFAYYKADRSRNVTSRHIILPLYTVYPPTPEMPHGFFKYDPHRINRTMRHELRHAVDFLDPKLIKSAEKYENRAINRYLGRQAYKNHPMEKRAFSSVDIEPEKIPRILKLYK